MTNISGEVN